VTAAFDTTRIEQMLRPMDLGPVPDYRDKHPFEIFEEFSDGIDQAVRNGGPMIFGGIALKIFKADTRPAERVDLGREFVVERKLRVSVPIPGQTLKQVVQFNALDFGPGLSEGIESPPYKKLDLLGGVSYLPELELLKAVGLRGGMSPVIDPEEEGLLISSLVSIGQTEPTDSEEDRYWGEHGAINPKLGAALKPSFGIAAAVLEKATVL
jgi:hypothetical protein